MTIAAPEFEIVELTIELAEKWLAGNVHNRSVRPRVVARFARDMRNGNWAITGETIAFTEDGRLLDGQHRLYARVDAGDPLPKPVLVAVVRGIAPEAQDLMDTGAVRTAGDQLKLLGHANSATVGATARWAFFWDNDLFYGNSDTKIASHADILQYTDAHPLLVACVQQTSKMRGMNMAPAGRALLLYLTMRIDQDAAAKFITHLNTGADISSGNPILTLRETLRRHHDTRRTLTVPDQISLALRAWNAWRSGRTLTYIPIASNGSVIKAPMPL